MFAFSEREIILKDNDMEPESWRFRIFFRKERKIAIDLWKITR